MKRTFNHKGLTPVRYNGYDIYTTKVTHKQGYRRWEQYLIKIIDVDSGVIVHQGQANANFGVYETNGTVTKQEVLEAAKKFIDGRLAGKKVEGVKKGDLFYTSWGYDQTNYDYIVVIAVSPTGKTVKARRTKYKNMGYSGQAHKQSPINSPFGDVFQLKVDYYNGKVNLRGSYPYSNDGTGYRRRGSFSKVKDDEVFYETDSRFGH